MFISYTLVIPRASTLLHFIAYASRSRLRPAIRRLWYMDEADKVQPNENHKGQSLLIKSDRQKTNNHFH